MLARVAARAMTTALVALPAAALSCGDGDGDPAATGETGQFPRLAGQHPPNCAGFAERLRACGLLTEGRFGCTDPTDAAGTCSFACITASSCELLWKAECQSLPNALNQCLTECQEFSCGDGSVIPAAWICDGDMDCFTGADEVDCELLTCADGSDQVPLDSRCDLFADCLDGSDEADCPTFQCDSGETITALWRCDGYEDCLDVSDEENCPIFTCIGDGSTVPLEWQCDQEHDCLDGSDEYGCAELLCR